MKLIYFTLILSVILISCEATTKELPDEVDVSNKYPERVIPLSEGNQWTYLIEGGETSQIRELASIGTQKWVDILDSANKDSDLQLGSFPSFGIIIDEEDSKTAYCYNENDIFFGEWDTTRNAYNIVYSIEDFPAIGRYSYDYRMIDIKTLELDAGRAYDCYIWENENTKDKYYYYRGLGLVRVELMDEEFNIIFSMQLTEYSIE